MMHSIDMSCSSENGSGYEGIKMYQSYTYMYIHVHVHTSIHSIRMCTCMLITRACSLAAIIHRCCAAIACCAVKLHENRINESTEVHKPRRACMAQQ